MKNSLLKILSVSILTLSTAQAQFNVDFGASNDPDPQIVQAGYDGWSADRNTALHSITQNFSNSLGIGDSIDVRVYEYVAHSNALDPRNYEPITSGPFLSETALLQDLVIHARLAVEISGLEYGEYNITSYHHATQYTNWGTATVLVDDADATNRIVASGVTPSTGTNPSAITTVSFSFTVDETTPDMSFEFNSSGDNFIINGFNVTAVPEPSEAAAMLGGFILLTVFLVRRFRKQ